MAAFVAAVTILALKWVSNYRALPPGPFLPLPILRNYCFWSNHYGKSYIDIILVLEKEYGGIFTVNTGNRRAVIISDIDTVHVNYSLHVKANLGLSVNKIRFSPLQTMFAKKVNMRPNEMVSQVYDPEYGVVFTNRDHP